MVLYKGYFSRILSLMFFKQINTKQWINHFNTFPAFSYSNPTFMWVKILDEVKINNDNLKDEVFSYKLLFNNSKLF